jgi:hypothetical protein
MIRLGLRLSVNGGKEAVVRLVVTAGAVALGVGLLLITLSGINAIHAQDVRTAWLNTSRTNARPSVPEATADPLWVSGTVDEFGSQSIQRVDLAPTGPRSPMPPGIPRFPAPGQFYASPELARLMRSTPAAELGARYPGRQVGTIGSSALASPKSLVIIIGHSAAELAASGDARQIRSFETAPQGAPGDRHPGRIQLILAVVAGALLFPVLIFIGAATRLAAARREQRFAALRLVGATPRQVSVIAAVEATLAGLAGVAAGFVTYFFVRPSLASVPFTGQPFFSSDLSLHLSDIAIVAFGVPIAAAVAARLALRRVTISPLGVTRRVTPAAPRAWRVIPLFAGIGELAFFVGRRPSTTAGQIRAYGAGFGLALAGLVIAGPWITMLGSRLMARRATRPAALIAGRRLSDNPRAAFRAVSGLIVALFISTASLGVISTIVAYRSASTGGAAGRSILSLDLSFQDVVGPDAPPPTGRPVSDAAVARLASMPGVTGVVVIHADPSRTPVPGGGPVPGLASCAQLARVPTFEHCAAGAAVASTPISALDLLGAHNAPALPTASVSPTRLASLPALQLDVATDGSKASIERARTAVETAFAGQGPPSTLGEISPQSAQLIAGWQRLADVAIVASLVIAACGLAVSVAAGLVDRKRPFSLMRLTGAPLGVLRRVVALEAVVPLVVIAVISAGTGLLAAHLFLRSQMHETLRAPGVEYYATVIAGLVAALGIIASTLPLLERITGPDVARND